MTWFRRKQAEASESVADEALEGASAAQEEEVAAAGEAEEHSTEEAAQDSKPAGVGLNSALSAVEKFGEFRDLFGAEFAAEAVEADLTLVKAYERWTARLTEEHADLTARLKAHIEAYGGMGASAAVSFDEQSAETVKASAREEELKKKGVSPGVARLAASLSFTKEGKARD